MKKKDIVRIYQAYLDEQAEVLRTRNPRAVQAFIKQHNRWFQPAFLKMNEDLDLVELSMHKLICARKDLSDLHAESQAWLTARGYSTTTF